MPRKTKKPPVPTYELKQYPLVHMPHAFKYGLIHITPDQGYWFSRFQVKMIHGYWNASQAKIGEPTDRSAEFADFICDLLVRQAGEHDKLSASWQDVMRRVVRRTIKNKELLDSIVSDCEAFGPPRTTTKAEVWKKAYDDEGRVVYKEPEPPAKKPRTLEDMMMEEGKKQLRDE